MTWYHPALAKHALDNSDREIARLREVVIALANASQSEATSRLRQMAKAALAAVANGTSND